MLQIATYIDAYYASYMNHATCMSATCIVQWFAMICYRSMICAHSEIGCNKYFVADGCWDRWIYILSYCILTRNQMSSQSVCRSMQSGIRMVQITELAKSILVDCWLSQVSWLIAQPAVCLKYLAQIFMLALILSVDNAIKTLWTISWCRRSDCEVDFISSPWLVCYHCKIIMVSE